MGFQVESLGYTIHTANNGNEALEALSANKIDVVISDVQMPNGTGLGGNISTTQTISIPLPNSTDKYYIISLEEAASYNTGVATYSEVDMSLDGGLGDVTLTKGLPFENSSTEKITAVKHANGVDYWLLLHKRNSGIYLSYLLTASGISSVSIESNVGVLLADGDMGAYTGYLKASLDGSMVAAAHGDNGTEVLQFDNSTGFFELLVHIQERHYGVEFSPNNNLLYVTAAGNFGSIYQYNLLAGSDSAIINSRIEIGPTGGIYAGALQIAPDHKIYHSSPYKDSIGVINNPNNLGVSCNYIAEGFWLAGKKTSHGLPSFYNSATDFSINIKSFNKCFGDSTQFNFSSTSSIDSAFWIFDDPITGIYNTSSLLNTIHVFSKTGSYNVSLLTISGGISKTTVSTINIARSPTIDLGRDTILCREGTIILDATTENATYLWQDNSTDSIFEVSNQGTYWVMIDVNNCIASDTIFIKQDSCTKNLEIPNVFTPNSDGQNDFFVPIKSDKIATMNTIIYNRWGTIVFETTNLKIEWDGGNVSDGTYFWVIQYSDFDDKQYTLHGIVTVVR